MSAELPQEDVATLSAVADFVVNLSIATRGQQMYGSDHPMARRATTNVMATLKRALELRDPISIFFTAEAIFCGPHCLERSHPIYRRFAHKMWHLGFAGVSFHRGIEEGEVTEFMRAVNLGDQHQESREEAERQLREAALPHIGFEMLHEVITYSTEEEVTVVSADEQAELWEDFMRVLGGISTAPRPGADEPRQPVYVRVPPHEQQPQQAGDYAQAVVDYMKQLQRAQRQDVLLASTDFGRKIQQFLQGVNPELRQQIMASAITAPEISPDTLQRLVGLVGHEHLLEALDRLNRAGEAIPSSALQTLSMLAMVQPDPLTPPGGAALEDSARRGRGGPPPPQPTAPAGHGSPEPPRARLKNVQELFDGLMAPDQASRYTTAEYGRILADIQARAKKRAPQAREPSTKVELDPLEGEKHFLLVASELMSQYPGDEKLASTVEREVEGSYLYFLEQGLTGQCRQAMRVAKRAGAVAGDLGHKPFVWETDSVLDQLAQQLLEGDRWESLEGGSLLVTIGQAAVPKLLDVLATSDSITTRKRVLEALEKMADSPAPQLLPLLATRHPWYLQRNAVHVLRRRQDPAGIAAAKALWPQAAPKVCSEILQYLIAVRDPERNDYLRSALDLPDKEVALTAARIALQDPEPEIIETIIQRADAIPQRQVGKELHLGLLRLLAQSGQPAARRYVQTTAAERSPLLPWHRQRYREEVLQMLGRP